MKPLLHLYSSKNMTLWSYLTPLFIALLYFGFSSSAYAQSTDAISWQSKAPLSNSAKKRIHQWLNHGAKASEALFTTLPQPILYFDVTAHPNAREPVPWGQVNRDGFNTIKLHVNKDASLITLVNDWTLYHEIAHLYLPFLDDESAWLSEGFASYIQNIAMLKANVHNKATFIKKIKAGLTRGENSTQRHQGRLNKVSSGMWSNRAYMRVYWSGAAFFLSADRELQATNSSLVAVISSYVNCCLTAESSGVELMTQLDKISQSRVFSTLFEQYRTRTDFPNIPLKEISASADYYLSMPDNK